MDHKVSNSLVGRLVVPFIEGVGDVVAIGAVNRCDVVESVGRNENRLMVHRLTFRVSMTTVSKNPAAEFR